MKRITDTRARDDVPFDGLTEVCDRMVALLPEGVRAVILLDADLGGGKGSGGMVAHGYEDDAAIIEAMRRHLQAFQRARLGA